MALPISNRLLACCGYVAQGDIVADIGCDHGYLGIYLLQNKIARFILAADVREGPLQSAIANAAKYGVDQNMSFYLSDGVKNVPREFDTLVCAGMGGDTMISILQAAAWLKNSRYRLVLQCQSKTPMLREYLSREGYRITEETVLQDGRFLYTVMEVIYEPGYTLTPGQCHFPPALLETPGSLVAKYYRWVVKQLRIATEHKADAASAWQVAALKELQLLEQEENLRWLKEENT